MAVPIVPFSVVKSQTMAFLGVSRTTYGTIDAAEKRWSTGEIEDAIIDADVEFQRAICETDKHPRRIMFYQAEVSVALGALIPAHVGPLGPVRIVYDSGLSWPGFRAPAEWIRTWSEELTFKTGTASATSGLNTVTEFSGPIPVGSDIGRQMTLQNAGPGDTTPYVGIVQSINRERFQWILDTTAAASTSTPQTFALATSTSSYGDRDACEGAWDIVEDRAYYIAALAGNSGTLKVTVCEVSRGTNDPATGLKSPLECINGIKGMALGTLFAKDAIKMDAAGYYAGYANMCLSLIRDGKMTFPPLMQFETGRTV